LVTKAARCKKLRSKGKGGNPYHPDVEFQQYIYNLNCDARINKKSSWDMKISTSPEDSGKNI